MERNNIKSNFQSKSLIFSVLAVIALLIIFLQTTGYWSKNKADEAMPKLQRRNALTEEEINKILKRMSKNAKNLKNED